MIWVVTGASSGIGFELSKLVCLEKKGQVLGVGRNEEKLKMLKHSFNECFDYVVADLSTYDGVNKVIDFCKKKFNKVDVLVNNAGFGLYKDVLDHDYHDVVSMAMVNFVAPIILTKELLQFMGKGSTVVMVITAGIHVIMKSLPIYGGTKIALHYVSKALKHELKRYGIHVVEVYPGLIRTDFHIKAGRRIRGGEDPTKVAKIIIKAVELKKQSVYIPRYLALLKILGPYLPIF